MGVAIFVDGKAVAVQNATAGVPILWKLGDLAIAMEDGTHAWLGVVPQRLFELPSLVQPLLAPVAWVVLAMGTTFLLSTVLLGFIHLPLVNVVVPNPLDQPKVAGRKLRKVSMSLAALYRRRAQAKRRWFLGKSRSRRGAVFLGAEREKHTWIVGGTGSGKTASAVLPALRADILAGRAVVFIDGKGDFDTAAELCAYAAQAGRVHDFRYLHLADPKRSQSYSPLVHGTATEKKDKIISAFDFGDDYYKKRAEEAALHLLAAFEDTPKPYCLEDLYLALSDIAAVRELGKHVRTPRVRRNLIGLTEAWVDLQQATTGLRTDLGLMTECEFGGLFRTYRPKIDFWNAYRRRQIVYLGLPTMKYQATAVRLARIMLSDLKTVASRIQTELPSDQRRFMCVAVDEFASFAFEEFAELINKTRSARIGLLLAHQSLSGDLRKASEHFFSQVVANTAIKVCLRQDDPDDAEFFARLSGTHTTIKRTEQMQRDLVLDHLTGFGSERRVDPRAPCATRWACSRMLNVAQEWGYVLAVPKISFPRRTKPRFRFLSAEERESVLAAAGPYWRQRW